MRDITLLNRSFADLNPLIIGEEECEPAHQYGPAVRNYTLLHFVVRGKGYFQRDGVTYPVSGGQVFVIRPDEVTTYFADESDPWYYQWIGFDGSLAKRFASLSPVFSYTTNWVEKMLAIDPNQGMVEYRVASLLFEMYAEIFAADKPQNHYVKRVKNYIDALYMQPLRVEEIADKMNLDRRYLSRLFKSRTGKTVQEYLIDVRINEAKKQLERGASVAEAAQLSGYDDVCNFSKMFKRITGISPKSWRKSIEARHKSGLDIL